MAVTFTTLRDLLNHGFDAVIDVRSPSEFAEDHIPDAVNLPVLDDDERAEVGTIYVGQSPFLARKIGAAKVFRNAARHIENRLMDFDGSWRPLVYCWRGGQRSGSFGWLLEQIGWRTAVLEGGYRSYRRLVNAALYDDPMPYQVILIDGYTGTAKTEILRLLQARGVQVLDLEGLANHRGSLLGAMRDPQPSQKSFESQIAQVLFRFDPGRPVLIEAESSKIGQRIIPPSLWAALRRAPRIDVTASVEARTGYLVQAYDDILSDAETLRGLLDFLRVVRGHAVVDGWHNLIAQGDKHALTRALIEQHYDPAYLKSRRVADAQVVARIDAGSLDPKGIEEVATRVEATLVTLDQPVESDS